MVSYSSQVNVVSIFSSNARSGLFFFSFPRSYLPRVFSSSIPNRMRTTTSRTDHREDANKNDNTSNSTSKQEMRMKDTTILSPPTTVEAASKPHSMGDNVADVELETVVQSSTRKTDERNAVDRNIPTMGGSRTIVVTAVSVSPYKRQLSATF